MSDGSAAFAEIETTDVAPAAEPVSTPVVDTTAPVATPDTVAANEDSFGKDALGDETKSHDVYNDGGSEELTADQKATKNNKEWATPGDWNIGGNGGGPLNQPTAADKAEKKREEDLDNLVDMIKEAHAEQERQREHARKWDGEIHEIAGVSATGREHQEMAAYLKTDSGKKRVLEQLMAEGMSKERAEKAIKRTQEMNELTEKMRLGTATEEEKRLHAEIQREQDVKKTAGAVKNQYNENGLNIKGEAKQEQQDKKDFDLKVPTIQKAGGKVEDTRILEARANFPGAVVLTGEFVDANSAKLPLDNPDFGKNALAKPTVVAAISKREAAAGIEL